MRALSLLLLLSAASAAEIPAGSHVLLRMENSVTTRTARPGDYVYLRTASPVTAANQILIPVGSFVQGVVTAAVRSGRMKGRASLAIRIDTFTTPTGTGYKITPHLASADSEGTDQRVAGKEGAMQAGASKGQDTGRIAIIAGQGAMVGAIADRSLKGAGIGSGAGAAVGLASVLLTRGKEVELRQGATLDVVFDRTVQIE